MSIYNEFSHFLKSLISVNNWIEIQLNIELQPGMIGMIMIFENQKKMIQKKILDLLANGIIDILPQGERFTTAVLEIKRLVGNVGFTGYYLNEDGTKKWLDIFNLKLEASVIEELYQITQNEFPKHKNWNRAIYTLFPEAKMNIQYIWDEQLQNEVDRLNNG